MSDSPSIRCAGQLHKQNKHRALDILAKSMAVLCFIVQFNFTMSGDYRTSNITDLRASITNVWKCGSVVLNFLVNTWSESNEQHNNSAYVVLAHVLEFSGSPKCDTAAHLYRGDDSMLWLCDVEAI